MNFNNLTYYEILEISSNATQEEIKTAFRKQAKKYHPDVNPSKDTDDVMKMINQAYDVLSDLPLRKKYDSTINKEKSNSSVKTNNNEKVYNSYTKTREESESDLDDWLKEYLKKRRNLSGLYQQFIKVEGNIINSRKFGLTPNPLEIAKSKSLLETIRKELHSFIESYNDNPVRILNFLFLELVKPTNNIGYSKQVGLTPNPADELLQSLVFIEIKLVVEKYVNINSEQHNKVISYILEKYAKTAYQNNNTRSCGLQVPPSEKLMEHFLLEILKLNKDYIVGLVNKDNFKL